MPGLITQQFFDSLTGEDTLEDRYMGHHRPAARRRARARRHDLCRLHHRRAFSVPGGHDPAPQPAGACVEAARRTGDPGLAGRGDQYFRDDVDQTEEAVSWSVDAFGLTCFAAVSSYILLKIDVQMTLLVFLPLVLVVTIAQLATSQLQKYRAASRESTARVDRRDQRDVQQCTGDPGRRGGRPRDRPL